MTKNGVNSEKFPEAPFSLTTHSQGQLISPAGIPVNLTIRHESGVKLIELWALVEKALLENGWQTRATQTQAQPTAAAPDAPPNGDDNVCPIHGRDKTKVSQKFNGLFCTGRNPNTGDFCSWEKRF